MVHCMMSVQQISIHALREEGDLKAAYDEQKAQLFLSTPSARRATEVDNLQQKLLTISIHALREEGDLLVVTPG